MGIFFEGHTLIKYNFTFVSQILPGNTKRQEEQESHRKLPVVMHLIVLKQKKEHSNRTKSIVICKRGTNAMLVQCGQCPVLACTIGQLDGGTEKMCLASQAPLVSLRAAAAPREDKSCSLRSPSRGSAWPAPSAWATGHIPQPVWGKHTAGTEGRTHREYLLSFTSPRTATN